MINIRHIFIVFWIALLLPLNAARADSLIAVEVSDTLETITITAAKTLPHKVFLLPNPNRLVVNIPSLTAHTPAALPENYKGKLLKNIRLGQFDHATSRLVFDLNQPIKVQKVHGDDSDKLVIDISGSDQVPPPVDAQSIFLSINPFHEKKKPKPQKPVYQKPVIVIDAGHGGQDPGTSGPGGNDEKDVVLTYALALRTQLMKTGHYKVVLTRDDDTFIMLRERVNIARKAGANLFISLHADSAPDFAARGLSVYTVSEKASDQESEKLAARENKSDVISGMDLSDESHDVADILISLAERDTKNQSATLADVLVTSLDGNVHLLSNSHRFAGFAVLKAPDVPSVLIEIGFLSHPLEENLLLSKTYRDKVTMGIATGVDQYFKVEKKLGEHE